MQYSADGREGVRIYIIYTTIPLVLGGRVDEDDEDEEDEELLLLPPPTPVAF